MMTSMNLYVIWDNVAKNSGFIFESTNDGTAVRSMKRQITDDKEDFDLLRIGTINHTTNKIDSYSPIIICNMGNVIEKEE